MLISCEMRSTVVRSSDRLIVAWVLADSVAWPWVCGTVRLERVRSSTPREMVSCVPVLRVKSRARSSGILRSSFRTLVTLPQRMYAVTDSR
jgi:hypothetical protein